MHSLDGGKGPSWHADQQYEQFFRPSLQSTAEALPARSGLRSSIRTRCMVLSLMPRPGRPPAQPASSRSAQMFTMPTVCTVKAF